MESSVKEDELILSFIEVKLKTTEDFLKVKETLTRIGVASPQTKTLYQSCHILHKRQRYYIVHFKELFLLDGKSANFDENDKARRNTIAKMLEQWGLISLVAPEKAEEPTLSYKMIKILPYAEKDEWNLVPKYNLGKRYVK